MARKKLSRLKGASAIGHTPREYAEMDARAKADREASNRQKALARADALQERRAPREIEAQARALRELVTAAYDAAVADVVQELEATGVGGARAAYLLEHGPDDVGLDPRVASTLRVKPLL